MRPLLLSLTVASMLALAMPHPGWAQPGATREAPLEGESWRLADAAYKAYEQKDYEAAQSLAESALRLRPDATRLWLLRIYSLDRLGRTWQALGLAERALQSGHRDSELDAVRNSLSLAVATARKPSLPAPVSAAAPGIPADAAKKTHAATPVSDPRSTRQARAWAQADAAYKAYAAKKYKRSVALAEQSLSLRPGNADMLALRAYGLEKSGMFTEAAKAADAALALRPNDSVLRATRDRLQQALASPAPAMTAPIDTKPGGGNRLPPGYQAATAAYAAQAKGEYADAAQFAGEAVAASPDNLPWRLLLVNAAALSGQHDLAKEAFSRVRERHELPPENLLDAAYAAQRLSDTSVAVRWFSQSIDAADAGDLALTPAARLNVRQAISDLDREWSATAALGYGTVGVVNPAFAPSLGKRKTLQSSLELRWRPPGVGMRDGRLEAYARESRALYDGTGGATGTSTSQAALGLRWKPLARQNVVLAAERLLPLGSNARRDWLLRVAWSAGEGGTMRADIGNWPYWQIYAEYDRFFEQKQTLGTVEARLGRAFAIDSVSGADGGVTLTPYLVLNANYDDSLSEKATLGAGPGVSARVWFRGDRYHAPRSYVDLNLQYRWTLAGDKRSNGVFAGFVFAY